MSAASQRAAEAASDIVEASNERPVEGNRVEQEVPRHAAGPTALAPNRTDLDGTDLDGTDPYLKGMLDLKLAKYAYAAGAAIVRTADEMSEEVLRIV